MFLKEVLATRLKPQGYHTVFQAENRKRSLFPSHFHDTSKSYYYLTSALAMMYMML